MAASRIELARAKHEKANAARIDAGQSISGEPKIEHEGASLLASRS